MHVEEVREVAQSREAQRVIRLILADLRARQLNGELTKVQEHALIRALRKAYHAVRVGSHERLLAAVSDFGKKYLRCVR